MAIPTKKIRLAQRCLYFNSKIESYQIFKELEFMILTHHERISHVKIYHSMSRRKKHSLVALSQKIQENARIKRHKGGGRVKKKDIGS